MDNKLYIENLYYDYKTKAGLIHALNGITCEFQSGHLYVITGRSGSGKSTLLSLIAAFDKPLSGNIFVNGIPIYSFKSCEFRKKYIGMVFQNFNLIQHLTATENVMLASSVKMSRSKAEEYMSMCQLDSSQFDKFPATLSGGEQQRVAIARALATDSRIILADEPTGSLDSGNEEAIIQLMKNMAHNMDKLVIIVSHSKTVMEKADCIIQMSDGKII